MRSKFTRNLSWIFFGNIVHAVLQFSLNIFCARAFGTNDYGIINYCASLIAFFSAIGTLGFQGVITRFFAEEEDKAGELLGTGIYARLVFSIFSIVFLQVIISFTGKVDSQIRLVVFCQSLQILFASADLYIHWFRFKGESKTVAIMRLMAFFVTAIWRIIAIFIYRSIVLYVIGVSLETGFFIVFQAWCFKKKYNEYKLQFSCKSLMSILKISYPFICSALLVTIYGQTDKIMLKNMLSNSAVGLYSVSLTLASVISIIPNALIDGFRPDIMTFRITDKKKYHQRMQQLYGLVFWISIAYCVFITILARPIVLLIYGEQYIGAVPSLALVVWYTSFSYFGSINNVYMVAEDKTKWVQVSTLVGALLNIILNLLLIPTMGIIGAALASLITQIFANFIMLLFIPALRGAFILIIQGITMQGFKDASITAKIKSLIGKDKT